MGCGESYPDGWPHKCSESTEAPGYVRLMPMSKAPKDGTEILAYHSEGKNFHPIIWVDRPWMDGGNKYWGMRWNEEYHTQDGFYDGWIPYPKLNT